MRQWTDKQPTEPGVYLEWSKGSPAPNLIAVDLESNWKLVRRSFRIFKQEYEWVYQRLLSTAVDNKKWMYLGNITSPWGSDE